MRSIRRTTRQPWVRDVLLVAGAISIVGMSFGAIAVGTGFPLWFPLVSSLLVFAGASQFTLVAVVGAGGSMVAAVAAGLVANARHLLFGLSLADVLNRSLPARLVGTHLMIDEATAFTVSRTDPTERRSVFWAAGVSFFIAWHIGVAIGTIGGSVLPSTDVVGLDAAFPAVLLALIIPALRERQAALVAGVGAVIAVVATPLLPPGLGVLLAVAALAIPMQRNTSPDAEHSDHHALDYPADPSDAPSTDPSTPPTDDSEPTR